jgi:hypothetical protein
MRKNEGKLIGILVTVIIHLIAGIIFMLLQITALKRDYSDKFEIEIAPVEETYVREKLIELPATTVERIFKGDDEMLNIARNLANKPDEKINPADYIDKVKEELIKSGKLSVNNYIDEQKRISEINETESIDTRNDTVRKNVSERPEKSQEIAANFKGPTRIYYNMTGRNHLYLPIPIYKCQGSGKVVLYIDVNQKGFVERALVIEEESSTSDPCLIETAVNTALVSRFNADINSPKIQRGTLSYQFVAQ